MSTANTSQTRDRLAVLLEEPLAAVGFDLEGVELSNVGKRRLLRVAVDKDAGVTMDDIAEATREVGRVLDDSEVMGERAYTLEVSSRGVDRPLTLPRHWRRNHGRRVEVRRTDREPVVGRIVGADDRSARLDVDGDEHQVGFDEVTKALVQVEFKPPGGPSGQAGPGPRSTEG